MVEIPLRKCYRLTRVALVLVIVVGILASFERWRGKRRTAGATLLDDELIYEQQIREDEARIIPGLGEGGAAVHLSDRDKELGEESLKKLAINVYLSDRIAYNRTLKDHRNPACKRVTYDAELPSASVILIFHNEPYSVVVRTIWSVLESARRDRPYLRDAKYIDRETGRAMTLGYPGQDPNSKYVYLKEIILVDDNSTLPELKGKLSYYIRTRMPPDIIRILRLPDRVGLTRARLAGARYSTGDVLVFLDSHCEVQPDWLRPILQRVKESPHTVAVPIIDVIDARTMYYSVLDTTTFQGLTIARLRGARSAKGDVLIFLDAHCEVEADWLRPLLQRIRHKRDAVVTPVIDIIDEKTFEKMANQDIQIGGFNFNGHFTWIDVPEREKQRRGSDISPTWSPTMAGGLFAINREYFWEIGAYDEQMAGWGGENLEMSFRLWQCGGTLETIPCSRVGHVFRAFHPYALPITTDTHGINTARMAEVWMDDYKELFYLNRPDLRKSPKIGDITHRKVLREKLQCKSFEWYLRHIYKEKFVPVRDTIAYGRFANPESGLCLDTLQRDQEGAPLGLYPCHPSLQGPQYLLLDLNGLLRDEERCAQLHYTRDKEDDKLGRKLLMTDCSKKQHGQQWRYTPSKQLIHSASGLCLEASYEAGADVLAKPCAPHAPAMKWDIDYNQYNGYQRAGQEPTEVELALQKLRGQRRISRSLAQSEENNVNASNSSARRRNKKRRKHKKDKHIRKRSKAKGKSKNKFILKLVRALRNGSEEHLEAEIRCKHRQLYSNNTFVRDLVTALNDNNIKVINNGRVFERNRVAEVPRGQTQNKMAAKGLGQGAVDVLTTKPPQPTTKQYERVHTTPPARARAVTKRWSHAKKKHHRDGYTDLDNNAQTQDREAKFNKAIVIEEFVALKHATDPTTPSYQPTTNRPEKMLKKKKKKKKHGKKAESPTKEVWLPDRRNMILEHEAHRHKAINDKFGSSTPPARAVLDDTRPPAVEPIRVYTEPQPASSTEAPVVHVWDKEDSSTERESSQSADHSEQEDRPTRKQNGDKDALAIQTLTRADTAVTAPADRRKDGEGWQRAFELLSDTNQTFNVEEFANKWRSEPVQLTLKEPPPQAIANASGRGKPTRKYKGPSTGLDQPSRESVSRESSAEDYSDTSSESAEGTR